MDSNGSISEKDLNLVVEYMKHRRTIVTNLEIFQMPLLLNTDFIIYSSDFYLDSIKNFDKTENYITNIKDSVEFVKEHSDESKKIMYNIDSNS